MKRGRPIKAAPWTPRTPATAKPDPITVHVRALVRRRAHSTCELCGVAVGTHIHHRQLRRFGNHNAENLLLLCSPDHTRVHGHPEWSRENGFLLRSSDDPATTPVAIHLSSWRLLLPDGTYRMDGAA